ncbi:MAG TPA: 30S ribosomal protein S6 [Candidatus Onthoplasma faecigallinarum]|nr:30S ribosomal protein S6 [Candidatus Onthoplasma faecigallinarum]
MNNYELMYIIPSQSTDEEKEAQIALVNSMIEKDGGKIESVERIGNRKLAYEIQKKREGFYVLVNFTADEKLPKRLASLLAITNGILRYIIVAK